MGIIAVMFFGSLFILAVCLVPLLVLWALERFFGIH